MRTRQQSNSPLVRITSGCLAVLILLLGIASVSPQMHAALHAETEHHHSCSGHGHEHDAPSDQSEEHSCAVTLFDKGAISVMPMVELPERTDAIVAIVPLNAETLWCGQTPIRRCSRAPPIESVV